MNAAANEDYQRLLKLRLAAGRYTLEEAALAIEEGTKEKERAAEILVKLMAAALAGDLLTYEPGKNARYTYGNDFASRVREFYEEARWEDLNRWLTANEPLIDFAFPDPADAACAANVEPAKGITKQQVIGAFAGLKFSRDRWSKVLADAPNWLKDCRVMRGRRGDRTASATWNPVLIATALFDKDVPVRKLDSVFVGLSDWADEWREKSESFRK